jgi:hypothetical protein
VSCPAALPTHNTEQRRDTFLRMTFNGKKDILHEIIECLSDETVKEWEEQFQSNQDAYYEEDDDD